MASSTNIFEKKLISVSRRTDILAFYTDWFLKILKSGFVIIENPFNHQKTLLKLTPENVLGFIFWSRYPAGIKKVIQLIDSSFGPNHYINLTINDYPKELEPRKPKLDKVLFLVDFLLDKYGDSYIKWRFDPIIISNFTPKDFIYDKFYFICKQLQGKVKTCITSFVDFYPKVKKRLTKKTNIKVVDLSFEEQLEIIDTLRNIAKNFGIEIKLCCERKLSKKLGIEPAMCVNPFQFSNYQWENIKMAPTRKDCTCYKSFDVGFYNSCLFDCIYCYSNLSYSNSLKKFFSLIK